MKFRIALTALAAAAALAGCSFQNKYEREAQKITEAVMANNLAPVMGDLSPGLHVSRVRVAAWSDELDDQGKLESIKEVTPCPAGPGVHCFDVKFEKNMYRETLALDDQNKVVEWNFHIADVR